MITIGSLCSGYGGLDLAVMDVFEARVAWHAQYDPEDRQQWAARILELRWPGVPNLGDITAADFGAAEPVDVLTAGWPCQDMSSAGRRAGLREGTRSGLWFHVARAISELRPRLVFLENVRALTSAWADSSVEPCPWCLGEADGQRSLRALGCVLGDLAELGFDAEWTCLRASDVGAAHRRERAFVLAWPAAEDPDEQPGQQRRVAAPGQAQGRRARPDAGRRGRTPAADPGRHTRPQDLADFVAAAWRRRSAAVGAAAEPRQRRVDWGPYRVAVERWEAATGREAPEPIDGRGRLAAEFVEFLMGPPPGWVTGVPGIPRRAALKALGNGVVPQQGAKALRLLIDRVLSEVG